MVHKYETDQGRRPLSVKPTLLCTNALGMSLLWILRDPKEGLVYLAKRNHNGQPISELNNDYYSKMKLF
jgi:hypothetical protein